jgi:hypothetical protein
MAGAGIVQEYSVVGGGDGRCSLLLPCWYQLSVSASSLLAIQLIKHPAKGKTCAA